MLNIPKTNPYEELSDKEVQILKLSEQKVPAWKIAQELGVSYGTVNNMKAAMRAKGVAVVALGKYTKLTEEMRAKIIVLDSQQKKNADMAFELGTTVPTLSHWKSIMRTEGTVFKTAGIGRPKRG